MRSHLTELLLQKSVSLYLQLGYGDLRSLSKDQLINLILQGDSVQEGWFFRRLGHVPPPDGPSYCADFWWRFNATDCDHDDVSGSCRVRI